jgi:CubicO group peptidase (beta-lactamase class C family)
VTPAPHPDSQSRIGSISKTFTAALVLGLRDEGKLALDEPIAAHLPNLAGIGSLTARQLLGHVSGLQREPVGPWWERAEGCDVDALLAEIGPTAAVHPPWRTYHYSNLGYGLLGAVVATITGESWYESLRSRILDPLDMRRTTYEATAPFLAGYVIHPFDGQLREEPRLDAGAMAPAGQLWSTVEDLARWTAFLLDPRPAVLSPATVAEMCAPVAISDLESWTSGHGLGVELWRAGERVYVGHTGSMPGYLAVLMAHRPTQTGVVAFANTYSLASGSIAGLGLDALTAVLDTEPEPRSPWKPVAGEPPAHAAPLLGTWWWMGRHHEMTWDGGLVMAMPDRPAVTPWRFTQVGADEWLCDSGENDGETMRVRRDGAGTPVELDIATFLFSRDPWPSRI